MVRLCLLADVRRNSSHVCSCNHINDESIICTSVKSHRVEFACTVYIYHIMIMRLLSARKIQTFYISPLKTIPGLVVAICEVAM